MLLRVVRTVVDLSRYKRMINFFNYPEKMSISFMDWSRERIPVHVRRGKRLPSHRQG